MQPVLQSRVLHIDLILGKETGASISNGRLYWRLLSSKQDLNMMLSASIFTEGWSRCFSGDSPELGIGRGVRGSQPLSDRETCQSCQYIMPWRYYSYPCRYNKGWYHLAAVCCSDVGNLDIGFQHLPTSPTHWNLTTSGPKPGGKTNELEPSFMTEGVKFVEDRFKILDCNQLPLRNLIRWCPKNGRPLARNQRFTNCKKVKGPINLAMTKVLEQTWQLQ